MTPRVVAALLAFFLGSFGFHKFYLGKFAQGILYALLCWTGIPGVIGVIESVLYLIKTDYEFERKYL